MWRWLPSVLCNKSLLCLSARRLFFLQLTGVVLGLHCAVLMLYGLIEWMQNGKDRFQISLTQSGATYVLMPFQKTVDQKNNKMAFSASNAYKKSNVINHATYEHKKKMYKKLKSTTASKKAVAEIAQAKAQKKEVQSVKQKASIVMQETPKSLKKSKKNAAKIQEIVALDVAPELPVKQKEIPAKTPVVETAKVQEVIPEQIALEPVTIELDDTQVTLIDDDFDEDNVIFVGQQDLDQSIIGSKIAHTIQQNWTPPVGMAHGVVCEIKIKIDQSGVGSDAKIVKGSGVFVYDASARKTLLKIDYPKEVWNKTITIALGSS